MQAGRALAYLGIRHIAAYSPAARGRSERALRMLQDRLPKELALAGITALAAANRFTAEHYPPHTMPPWRFAPAEAGPATMPTVNAKLGGTRVNSVEYRVAGAMITEIAMSVSLC